jgi:hypothetical protein
MRAYFADMSKSPRVVFIMQRIAEDDWQIVSVSSHGTIHASCKLRYVTSIAKRRGDIGKDGGSGRRL